MGKWRPEMEFESKDFEIWRQEFLYNSVFLATFPGGGAIFPQKHRQKQKQMFFLCPGGCVSGIFTPATGTGLGAHDGP